MSNLSRRSLLTLGGVSALSLATSQQSCACFNDRDTDTLVEEAKAFPGMVAVITGRFERNPPLYYQMRIDRIAKILADDDQDFKLFDDIAVAYDRIGKSDKALAWMGKKRKAMGDLDLIFPPFRVAWYRYYANTGTSRVHRWLREGADRVRIAEVKQARAEIVRALEINPKAHFGRENYQLQMMEWIINEGVYNDADKSSPDELGRYLEARAWKFMPTNETRQSKTHAVVQGLAGLVVLENAWESVDIFQALSYWLTRIGDNSPAYLAMLRREELAAKGGKSLFPDASPYHKYRAPHPKAAARLKQKYAELRAKAEEWQKERAEYMMARLQAGQHPDTDPDFWADWHPAPTPTLSTGFWAEQWDKVNNKEFASIAIAGAFTLTLGGVIVEKILRRRNITLPS